MFGIKQSVYDSMLAFFKEDDWRFDVIPGKSAIKAGFKGQNAVFQLVAQANEQTERLNVYSVLDIRIPADKRQAIAEYLTRANYGLNIGNFELDFSDGEVRYKTSIDVEGGQLTSKMIKNLVYVNVLMMDKYQPGIMAVVYGGKSPADAVAEVEKK